MIRLDDKAKKIIRRNKGYFEKNNFEGFFTDSDFYGYNAPGKITEFLLENGVDIWRYLRTFPNNLFRGATFKTFDIPEGIGNSISFRMFAECPNLQTVTIPDNIKYINDEAFYDCPRLSLVHLPGSVIDLGNKCFAHSDNVLITTERRTRTNSLDIPTSEIEWYKKHLGIKKEED